MSLDGERAIFQLALTIQDPWFIDRIECVSDQKLLDLRIHLTQVLNSNLLNATEPRVNQKRHFKERVTSVN